MYEGKVVEIQVGNEFKKGMDIEIEEENLKWSEVRLKDGSILWMKIALRAVTRLDEYDVEGNPKYMINAGQTVMLSYLPKELKKRLIDIPRVRMKN